MSPINPATIRPADLLHTLRSRWQVWVLPAAGLAVLAGLYAIVRPANWVATQALIVRDEAAGSGPRSGRFSHVDEMKTAQETILELAKSRTVLSAALVSVGPPTGRQSSAAWPSDKEVEALQSAVKLSPPKGAEFGKTEVFYLTVQDRDRSRACALALHVAGQLQTRFDELRRTKAQSVVNELVKTVSLAHAELDATTTNLASLEAEMGSDLAELRILNEHPSGDSDLRRTATELETELRTSRATLQANQELRLLLVSAQTDPGRLLATPSRLLESQPALKRLKDGLVDAQLRTAALASTMTTSHPAVLSSKEGEQEISQHLHDELVIAIKGIDADARLANERIKSLETQREQVHARLNRLAAVRAPYANRVAAMNQRSETLKVAETELADARAFQSAARTVSLISLIDQPDTGTSPAGPSRAMIVLIGLFGGLATGVGVVVLSVSPASRPSYFRVDGQRVRHADVRNWRKNSAHASQASAANASCL